MVQNALTNTRAFDCITAILASFHQLSIHVRLDFNVLMISYKILSWHALQTCLVSLNLAVCSILCSPLSEYRGPLCPQS